MGRQKAKAKTLPCQKSLRSVKEKDIRSSVRKTIKAPSSSSSQSQISNVRDKGYPPFDSVNISLDMSLNDQDGKTLQYHNKEISNIKDSANSSLGRKHIISSDSQDKNHNRCCVPVPVPGQSVSHSTVKSKNLYSENPLIISCGKMRGDTGQQRRKEETESRRLVKDKDSNGKKDVDLSNAVLSNSVIDCRSACLDSSDSNSKISSKKKRVTFDCKDETEHEDLMAGLEITAAKAIYAKGVCQEEKQKSVLLTKCNYDTDMNYLGITQTCCCENLETPPQTTVSTINDWKHQCHPTRLHIGFGHGSFSRIRQLDETPTTRGIITLRRINLLKLIETPADLLLIQQRHLGTDFIQSSSQVHSVLHFDCSKTNSDPCKTPNNTLKKKPHLSPRPSMFSLYSLASDGASSGVSNNELNEVFSSHSSNKILSNHEKFAGLLAPKKKNISDSEGKTSETKHKHDSFSKTFSPKTFCNSFVPSVSSVKKSQRKTALVSFRTTDVSETDESSHFRNQVKSKGNASLSLELDESQLDSSYQMACSTPYSEKLPSRRALSIGNVSLPSFEDFSFSPVPGSSIVDKFISDKKSKGETQSFSETKNVTYIVSNPVSFQVYEGQGPVTELHCEENKEDTQICETHTEDKNVSTKQTFCSQINSSHETNNSSDNVRGSKSLEEEGFQNNCKKMGKRVFRNKNALAVEGARTEPGNNKGGKSSVDSNDGQDHPSGKKKADAISDCGDRKLKKILASPDGHQTVSDINGWKKKSSKSLKGNLKSGKKQEENLKHQNMDKETKTVKSKVSEIHDTKSKTEDDLVEENYKTMMNKKCEGVGRMLRPKKCQALEQDKVTRIEQTPGGKIISVNIRKNSEETNKPTAGNASKKKSSPVKMKGHKTVKKTKNFCSPVTVSVKNQRGSSKSGVSDDVKTGKSEESKQVVGHGVVGKKRFGSRKMTCVSDTKFCEDVKDITLETHESGQNLGEGDCQSKLDERCSQNKQLSGRVRLPRGVTEKGKEVNKQKKASHKVQYEQISTARRTRKKVKNSVNESVSNGPAAPEMISFVSSTGNKVNLSSSVICPNPPQPLISESVKTRRKLKDQKTSTGSRLLAETKAKKTDIELRKQNKVTSCEEKKTSVGKSKSTLQERRKVTPGNNKIVNDKTKPVLKVGKVKVTSCDKKDSAEKKNELEVEEGEQFILPEEKNSLSEKSRPEDKGKVGNKNEKEFKMPMRKLRKRKIGTEVSSVQPSDQVKVGKTLKTSDIDDKRSVVPVSVSKGKAKKNNGKRQVEKTEGLAKIDSDSKEELDQNGFTRDKSHQTKKQTEHVAKKTRGKKETKIQPKTEDNEKKLKTGTDRKPGTQTERSEKKTVGKEGNERKPESEKTESQKYVGAHCSIAGGVSNAVTEAVSLGARAFALFVRNGRTWKLNPLVENEAEKFKSACKIHGFPPHLIIPHGSYLLNCGSSNEETLKKSRDTLIHELQICEKLGLTLYNFHPGSACGKGSVAECIQTIADSINLAHRETKFVKTVIENMSCQGQTVGGKFEELKAIIDKVKDKSRIGVCLDTCHAFAAGFDLSCEAGFAKFMEDFDTTVGFQYLCAVHLNDSKGELGCHLDRHENIGKGHIGIEGFRRIMNDPRFNNIPMVLETPVNNYAKEIQTLCQLENL